jgi:ParB-like nuclease domain
MAGDARVKTGGRKAGTPNRPKAPLLPDVPAQVFQGSQAVTGLPGGVAAAPSAILSPSRPRVRAREANDPELPPYRLERIARLMPYANNARTHTPAQITKIAASIREFGWTNPVLVDSKRRIIAGHGRVLAAKKLGLGAVPVIELSHLSDAQRRAYVIADNKIAEAAGWDAELLALELGDLRDEGFDLGPIGFDGHELDALFGDAEGQDPDDAPETNAICPQCGRFLS